MATEVRHRGEGKIFYVIYYRVGLAVMDLCGVRTVYSMFASALIPFNKQLSMYYSRFKLKWSRECQT